MPLQDKSELTGDNNSSLMPPQACKPEVRKFKSAMLDWHLTSKLQLDMGPDEDQASVKTVESTPDSGNRMPTFAVSLHAAV